jgi:F-type H+-transporting ATPase subunit b
MVDVLPNYSVFIQLINFIVLLVVLNFVLYKPIRGILAKRKEKIAGLNGDITTSTEGAKSKQDELDNLRMEANRQGAQAREELKGEGQAEERKLIDAATAEMEASVAKVRKQVSEEIGKAREELKGEVQAFGRELAQKILGRSIQ